jgi:protein-L-isoaspartate O-methyltransferase
MVALICEQLALHGIERTRRRHGLRLPGRGARRAGRRGPTIERIPSWRSGRRDPRRDRVRTAFISTWGTAPGVPEHAPFAAIAVAAALEPPPSLYEQLEPRGRLVVPVGGAGGQWLEVVVRTPDGPAVLRSVPCRFVPLVAGL